MYVTCGDISNQSSLEALQSAVELRCRELTLAQVSALQ